MPLALLLSGLIASVSVQGASPSTPQKIAEVDVNVVIGAPPPPRQEIIVERDRPSRDHVWIRGYWIRRHGHHEWVAGHWERPPHGRTVWIEPRWEKRGRSYVFIEGYWEDSRHDHGHDRDHDHH